MKKCLAIFVSFALTVTCTVNAFGWGDKGHETVGKIASLRIKPKTAQRLARILQLTDPNTIRQRCLPNDRGGNQLIIDNDRKNLHGFWDFDLVESLMAVTNKPTSDQLGRFLRQTVTPKQDWSPQGSINTWAAAWATDSLNLSRQYTYRSVRLVRQRTIPVLRDGQPVLRDGKPVTQIVYDITRPNNYKAVNRENVRRQLAKAGFRLAKLLDAIYAE